MSTQCRWLHKWGKWARQGFTINYVDGTKVHVDKQQRECERCGRIQVQDIT